MAKSRRANAVVFGFDFQVNAAIVLMIENIEDLKSLRLEGNYEDIEIELENNQYILAQAKAVERSSSDFRNVRKNLEKSLISLSEGNQKVDAQRLILITNSPNPLNEEASRSIFWGDAHREFLSLPESSQELIRRYLDNINQPLDTDKFMIQILPFETDNDIERYKVVKRVVDDFIGDLNLNIPGLGKKLLSIWHEEVFENGTKKDAAIQLKKKDLISVYEMFAFPYHVIGITQQEDEQLSAAETWPLVASSLSYSGTLGPYWYFVRKTVDLGQLESYINRAAKYAGKTLKNGIKEFKPYIEKMRKEIPLSKNEKQIAVLLSEYEKSGEKKKRLIDLSEKYIGKEKQLCQEAQDDLQKLMEEELHVGDLLIKLVENVYSFQTEESQKYWARTLCECATELEDARGLYAVISETNFSSAYTAVRKAFRIIDFINYGPKLE